MKLAQSSQIRDIDRFAAEKLGLPTVELMGRSGRAVESLVREIAKAGSEVVIFSGCGNNGGDGYAAATGLMNEYKVTVFDVFSLGQKTQEGKHYLELYRSLGGRIVSLKLDDEFYKALKNASVIIDAVFGTGFRGEISEDVKKLASAIRDSSKAKKIAIDLPIGVDPDSGAVSSFVVSVDYTVALSFIKPGLVSYPAKAYVGKLVYDSIGLPIKEIEENFVFKYTLTDHAWAKENFPKRESNSNKGTFGKALLITGSAKYRGAASLSVSASLRGGCGYTAFLGERELVDFLAVNYPEVIYHSCDNTAEYSCELSKKHTVTLIGSGSDNTDTLQKTVFALLKAEGGTLILDADAINALSDAGQSGIDAIKNSNRPVIITPHPLEFARLSGNDVNTVQSNRLELAIKFAKENKCVVVLKGAATIITDGESVFINGSGSSALAKAGSGDVLAGFLASFAASTGLSPVMCAAYAAYLHGKAADDLADKYSTYGVTPSDLPIEIARCMKELQNK